MANFIYAFHGGAMPDTPEEGAAVMAKWGAWMAGLGSALVHPGAPVGMSKTVSASGIADNGGANPVSGYMVISAADMDAACEIAKGCPIIDNGGSVEIAEEMEM